MRTPIQQRQPAHPAAVATTTGGTVKATVANKAEAAVATTSAAPAPVSFAADIQPLFAQFQGPMMWRFDLTSYEAVMGNAQTIYDRISSAGSPMPPPPFDPLTPEQIAMFQQWINDGCLP
jgi:hypothetical protein